MFEKWILKRAKKIEAKKKIIQAAAAKVYTANYERKKLVETEAKKILYHFVDEIASKMVPDPRAVKEGDRAILNIYQMIFDSLPDSWDGGAGVLQTHTPEDQKKVPMFVTIKKISVEKSQVRDRIDNFLSNTMSDALNTMINTSTVLENFRKTYTGRSASNEYHENLGMYFSATFDTETTFKPTWTLNIGSFLKEGTEEANITAKIWKEELDLKKELTELNKRKEELNKRKIEIDERHRGIRIVR
jgi:hypothetical protein